MSSFFRSSFFLPRTVNKTASTKRRRKTPGDLPHRHPERLHVPGPHGFLQRQGQRRDRPRIRPQSRQRRRGVGDHAASRRSSSSSSSSSSLRVRDAHEQVAGLHAERGEWGCRRSTGERGAVAEEGSRRGRRSRRRPVAIRRRVLGRDGGAEVLERGVGRELARRFLRSGRGREESERKEKEEVVLLSSFFFLFRKKTRPSMPVFFFSPLLSPRAGPPCPAFFRAPREIANRPR